MTGKDWWLLSAGSELDWIVAGVLGYELCGAKPSHGPFVNGGYSVVPPAQIRHLYPSLDNAEGILGPESRVNYFPLYPTPEEAIAAQCPKFSQNIDLARILTTEGPPVKIVPMGTGEFMWFGSAGYIGVAETEAEAFCKGWLAWRL